MVKKKLKEEIANIVRELQGCKAVPLATHPKLARIFGDYHPGTIFDEMVKEGMLVEVQYELPNMSYRTKCFYLPGGTKARIT